MALILLLTWSSYALTLDEAIALGKERSLRMEAPRIDRQRIHGRIVEAWSNALPQIEGQIGYQRAWKKPVMFVRAGGEMLKFESQLDNSSMAEATLTQPLLTFGRVSAGLRAAHAAGRSNDHLMQNTSRALELEVMRRFWTVLLIREVVDVRRHSLAISDSSLVRVQRMRDVGLMSDYDVLRVQVQANNQIPPLKQVENNLRLAELSFREILGVPVDTPLTAEGRLTDSMVPIDTSGADVMHRDDLEALRDLADVYQNVYVIFHNARWPTLAGQLKYSWQWSDNTWDIHPRNNASSFYGGIALQIPIWTSGADHGRAQQYRADWRQSLLDLQQAERGAQLQYETATRSYQTAVASEAAATLAVTQAEEARAIAQTKLAQGQITPLEMDAAQLDELVAKVALAQAKYDRLVSAAEARMAVGLSPYTR